MSVLQDTDHDNFGQRITASSKTIYVRILQTKQQQIRQSFSTYYYRNDHCRYYKIPIMITSVNESLPQAKQFTCVFYKQNNSKYVNHSVHIIIGMTIVGITRYRSNLINASTEDSSNDTVRQEPPHRWTDPWELMAPHLQQSAAQPPCLATAVAAEHELDSSAQELSTEAGTPVCMRLACRCSHTHCRSRTARRRTHTHHHSLRIHHRRLQHPRWWHTVRRQTFLCMSSYVVGEDERTPLREWGRQVRCCQLPLCSHQQ